MNKEESGCAPAAYCHRPPAAASLAAAPATSGVGYLCLAIPSGGQSYRYHDHCCTLYSTSAAIARTSIALGSAGSSVVLTTDVVAVISVWFASCRLSVSSVCDLSCLQ